MGKPPGIRFGTQNYDRDKKMIGTGTEIHGTGKSRPMPIPDQSPSKFFSIREFQKRLFSFPVKKDDDTTRFIIKKVES